MRWPLLLSTVQKDVRYWGHPHAVVIQLGENDSLREKRVVLSRAIMQDLQTLHQKLPNSLLLWSCLLQFRVWEGVSDPEKVDLARRRACKAVVRFLSSVGVHAIRHPEISLRQKALYRRDDEAWISGCKIFTRLC